MVKIFCGITKVIFETPVKISYPCFEDIIYSKTSRFQDILNSWAFWTHIRKRMFHDIVCEKYVQLRLLTSLEKLKWNSKSNNLRYRTESKHAHGSCFAVFSCAFVIMITSSSGNIFHATGHMCGEFTGHRWIPRAKASDAELGCFLWSAPE